MMSDLDYQEMQTTPQCGQWLPIISPGEIPIEIDGEPQVHVFDEIAMQAMVANFQILRASYGDRWAGLLVDVDHESYTGSTVAYGWLKNVCCEGNELLGYIEWTALGAEAMSGKLYKYTSCEYMSSDLVHLDSNRYRPTYLRGISLTNRPRHIRIARPICNSTTQPLSQVENENETQIMNPLANIATALGLDPASDEAAILAAITALQAEVTEYTDKAAAAAADMVLNSYAGIIPVPAVPHWREQLIKNHDAAVTLLKSTFDAATKKRTMVLNRATIAPLSDAPAASAPDTASQIEQLVQTHVARGIKYADAYKLVRAQHPHFFV